MSCQPGNITCNFAPGSPNYFTGEVEQSAYNYLLNQTACIAFVVFFGLSAALHFGQAVWSRQWWLIYTLFFGAVGETIGWSGRLWSSISETWDPSVGGSWTVNETSFLMQISSLIMAPAFMAAGNYILLGRIIPVLGTRYSFIHPTSYTIVFVFGDLVSLIVQAIGGGKASAAETLEGANAGARVMVGGVMFQMVVMIAYTAVLLAFVIRYRTDRPIRKGSQIELFRWWPNALRPKSQKKPRGTDDKLVGRAYNGSDEVLNGVTQEATPERVESGLTEAGLLEKGEKATPALPRKAGFGDNSGVVYTEKEVRGARVLLWACAASTLLIFIRSVYRSIELIDGWEGEIMLNQPLFNFLDGMLMCLAVWIFNIVHPGFFLPRRDRLARKA
ncbi:hypothetical protein NliqN6_4366 [Naganishia liquefaciens]|uniref:Uncharacterized protein n=1 Tax=Naganishia liquefaciens TaxID=104408 RepID=A0A8H3TXF6_9TREE|nr:hypothetical protein NliqN6_4366 [Naganishia liquefaciens]